MAEETTVKPVPKKGDKKTTKRTQPRPQVDWSGIQIEPVAVNTADQMLEFLKSVPVGQSFKEPYPRFRLNKKCREAGIKIVRGDINNVKYITRTA